MVSFHRSQLDNHAAFPEVVVRPLGRFRRALKAFAPSRAANVDVELAGGRLEVRSDGFAWRAGSALTPFGATSGGFFVAWADIKDIAVLDIPYKVNSLGGNLTVTLGHRVTLSGEFLGSQSALREAIGVASGRSWPSDHTD
jgi:hypothetical protein